MNWRLVGIGGGFLAFCVVNIFVSAFIGPGFLLTFVPGLVAAWWVWKVCTDKEKAELDTLMNPPEETWPVPLPVAWGTVKDVLDSAKVHTRHAGTSGWHVQKEDDSRGLIKAQLNFTEQVGGLTNAQMLPRTVEISVILKPDGSSTKVETHYQVFSPMNFNRVREIVSDTQKDLRQAASAGKESQ